MRIQLYVHKKMICVFIFSDIISYQNKIEEELVWTQNKSLSSPAPGLPWGCGGGRRRRGRTRARRREASRDPQWTSRCLHPAPQNPQRAGESAQALVRAADAPRKPTRQQVCTNTVVHGGLSLSLCPHYAGRRARGSQTSSCPGEPNS